MMRAADDPTGPLAAEPTPGGVEFPKTGPPPERALAQQERTENRQSLKWPDTDGPTVKERRGPLPLRGGLGRGRFGLMLFADPIGACCVAAPENVTTRRLRLYRGARPPSPPLLTAASVNAGPVEHELRVGLETLQAYDAVRVTSLAAERCRGAHDAPRFPYRCSRSSGARSEGPQDG